MSITSKHGYRIVFFLLLSIGIVLIHATYQARVPFSIERAALWVPRFDYATQDDVKQIIKNAAETGFTDVFFQIRGNGTVFYPSQYEPWAHDLNGGNLDKLGEHPGWNPLQVAIDQAALYNVRLHAYINVLPGWKGRSNPPTERGQPWADHPDWFMKDAEGNTMQPTSGWYTFLNPAHPDVIRHLSGLIREIMQYQVAGIHLDYIRYPYDYVSLVHEIYPDVPNEDLNRYADFSYDIHTEAQMHKLTGSNRSKEARMQVKTAIIANLVDELSRCVKHINTNAILSASVLGNPIDAQWHAGQVPSDWVNRGAIDWAVQMNYGRDTYNLYAKRFARSLSKKQKRNHWMMGITAQHSTREIQSQFKSVAAYQSRGVAFFSYGLLYDEHTFTEKSRLIKRLLEVHLVKKREQN
jgi:uncharacterized lipoprotein YddW (UPF0748 family)